MSNGRTTGVSLNGCVAVYEKRRKIKSANAKFRIFYCELGNHILKRDFFYLFTFQLKSMQVHILQHYVNLKQQATNYIIIIQNTCSMILCCSFRG